MADQAVPRVIPPEQTLRARQRSRLTSVRRRVEKFKSGEPAPTSEDLWALALAAAPREAPPTPELRKTLRALLDMTGDGDGTA